ALIGPIALRGVLDLELAEQGGVERLGGLGDGLAILDDRHAQLHHFLPPRLARLGDAGVRQDIVWEKRLRDLLAPRHPGAGLVGEVEILEQKIGLERLEVLLRHVGDQKRDAGLLLLRRGVESLLQFGAVGFRLDEGSFDVLVPPALLLGVRESGERNHESNRCTASAEHGLTPLWHWNWGIVTNFASRYNFPASNL